jgi:hypothetical protein
LKPTIRRSPYEVNSHFLKTISMKYKQAIVFLLFLIGLFITSNIHAQKTVLGIPHTNHVHKNSLRQFYFLDAGYLLCSEVYRGLPKVEYTQTKPYVTNQNLNDLSDQSVVWGFLGVRINQRLNIIEYNDIASLSVVIPAQFTMTAYGLTLFAPITLQTNLFWQSTKTELDNYGFNLGVGYGKIRLIYSEELLREHFANAAINERFFLLNAGLTFNSSINNQPRRIDYWIGKRPRFITHAGDGRFLANYYFSIAYTTTFLIR